MSDSRIIGLLAVFAVAMLASSACIVIADDSSASEAFTVKYSLKGTDYSVDFDGPVNKVTIFGYAPTLTVLDADKASKIYAVDEYGKEAFTDKGVTDTSVSIPKMSSSSNVDAIYSQLIQAVDDGKISLDDAIILTTYETNAKSIRDKLATAGFTHIVYYGTMDAFPSLIKCIGEIEKIVGSEKNLEKNMQTTYDTVIEKMKGVEKKDAIYLRYSASSGWGYGGSICSSMIIAGGGNNIGATPNNKTVYDQSKIVQLLEASPEAMIFLDGAWIRSNGGTVDSFVDEVMGGDMGKHGIVVVEKTWNNYDPEAADGLWNMAGAMHPDIIDSDVVVYRDSGSEKDNTIIYVAIGVAAIVILAGALIILRMRK